MFKQFMFFCIGWRIGMERMKAASESRFNMENCTRMESMKLKEKLILMKKVLSLIKHSIISAILSMLMDTIL